MSSTEPRDQLADLLAEHLYDRGEYVADWPEDERALQRDINAWTDFRDRAEKVQRLRFEKAADAVIAFTGGWRPPPRVIETPEELDALSTGTAILASGEVYLGRRLEVDGAAPILWYWAFGVLGRTSVMVLAACGDGVTVLWEPEEDGR